MKVRNIIKMLMFSAIIAALFAVTFMFSSAANQKMVVTGGREYYSEEEYDWVTEEQDFTVEYGDSFEFTGSAIDPGIKVYKGTGSSKTLLTPNDDYYIYVNYDYYHSGDIMSPGEYYVEIYSGDDYEYIFDCEFDIDVTFDSSKLKIGSISSKTYTGEVYKPTIKVYYGETRLSSKFYDTDVDYGSDAGTYYVYVEMESGFDYYEMSKSYKIKPASAENVIIGGISNKTYNGYEICPKPSVRFNDKKLEEYYDFDYSYSNNENAGTATVTINFRNNFTGTKTVDFTIKPLSASKVTVDSIPTQDYTGSEVKPYIYVNSVGWNWFEQGYDYTVSYSNNVKVGTATAKIKFTNPNISGTKTLQFKIAVGSVEVENASVYSNYVELDWWCYNDYSFKVYKYDSSSKKYVLLKSTKYNTFTDKDVKEFKTYKYKVRAYVKIDGTTYYGPYSDITVKTGLFPPTGIKLSVGNGKNTLTWKKKSNATGYYVYRYDDSKGTYKKIKSISSNSTVKYVDDTVKNYNKYTYWLVAYKKDGDKTIKSSESEYIGNLDPRVIANCAKLTPRDTFTTYNVQNTKTTVSSTHTLSKSDIKTLDNFAKKYFKSGWSNYDKVEFTLHWIHDNVTYASATANWNKISNKSYVDAIFNYKLGQCAQYNGAIASMMAHMGYDVQMVKGYRKSTRTGSVSQHFWTEVKINGLTYLMECGNKKDGNWFYIFAPYNKTSGYMKNGKLMN